MRTVWKQRIDLYGGPSKIDLPEGARLVHLAAEPTNRDVALMWFEVDTDAPKRPRYFAVCGTGYPIPDSGVHVGTVIVAPFVWHVYQMSEADYEVGR